MNASLLREVSQNPENPKLWSVQTAEKLFQVLDKQYVTLDLAHNAAIKFEDLQQNNKPFQNFVATFVFPASKCRKNNEQMVEALKKKVSPEIATALRNNVNPPARDSFEAWSDLCQTLYKDHQELDHYQKHKSKPQQYRPGVDFSNQYANQTSVPACTTSDEGDPMELDLMKANDHQRCFEDGLCYYCKVFGHIAKDCLSKKAADARNIARGSDRGGRGSFFTRGGLNTNWNRGRGRGFNFSRGRGQVNLKALSMEESEQMEYFQNDREQNRTENDSQHQGNV